jgi:hypothetical protein
VDLVKWKEEVGLDMVRRDMKSMKMRKKDGVKN